MGQRNEAAPLVGRAGSTRNNVVAGRDVMECGRRRRRQSVEGWVYVAQAARLRSLIEDSHNAGEGRRGDRCSADCR